jgi:hypothetical protein
MRSERVSAKRILRFLMGLARRGVAPEGSREERAEATAVPQFLEITPYAERLFDLKASPTARPVFGRRPSPVAGERLTLSALRQLAKIDR